jgi:hypothetical protein
MTPEFRGGLYAVEPGELGSEYIEETHKKHKKARLIPLELQNLFSQLQLLDQNFVSTKHLTEKGFRWEGADGSVQHDVQVRSTFFFCDLISLFKQELNRLLFDAIERSLAHTSGEKLIDRLYSGSLANQVLFLAVPSMYLCILDSLFGVRGDK